MRKILFLLCCVSLSLSAQYRSAEQLEVLGIVNTTFKAIKDADVTVLKSQFVGDANLCAVYVKDGVPGVRCKNLDQFAEGIAAPHEEPYIEKLYFSDIKVNKNMANVWCDYSFFIGEKFSHCGTNSIQLIKLTEGWKITNIVYNISKESCEQSVQASTETHEKELTASLDTFVDNWHKAASDANADQYFGMMSDHGIFIGTDSTEHWTKEEFFAYCDPHFQKGKAWSFTATGRNFFMSSDYSVIWFDELLDTWMGKCRGSGVLEQVNGEWKMTHYHLSIAVPNEHTECYIKLINKEIQCEEEVEAKKGKRKKKKSKKS